MRVLVPFAYKATYRNPASGKTRSLAMAELIGHDIPEIDGTEAPPIARWTHGDQVSPAGWVECRMFDGNYHYPVYNVSGPRVMVTTGEIAAYFATLRGLYNTTWYSVARHAWHYDRHRQRACQALLTGEAGPTPAYGAVELGNDRDREFDLARRGLSDLLVIDGTVWCRGQPPRLCLSVWDDGQAEYGYISVNGLTLPGSPHGLNHPFVREFGSLHYEFRLGDQLQVEAFAARRGIETTRLVEHLSFFGVEFDRGPDHEEWLRHDRANRALERIGRKLGDLSASEVTAWLNLRSAISSSPREGRDEIEELMEHLRSELSIHGHHDPALGQYSRDLEAMRSIREEPHPGKSPRSR